MPERSNLPRRRQSLVMLRSPSKTCMDHRQNRSLLPIPQLVEEITAESREQAARHYLDGDSGLLVLVGGEHLRLFGWDDSVPRDQLGHDSTDGLNTQGEGSHIKEEDICTEAKSHFCKQDDH